MTHERVHTREKPFKCSKCEKAFSESGKLKVHDRTHTDEKPFSCSLCDKKFRMTHQLKAHGMLHTGTLLQLKNTTMKRKDSAKKT